MDSKALGSYFGKVDLKKQRAVQECGSPPPPWSIDHWAMGAKGAEVASMVLSSL